MNGVSQFPYVVQNIEVTKEIIYFFRLQVLFMFMHPLRYLQVNYCSTAVEHKNVKAKLTCFC